MTDLIRNQFHFQSRVNLGVPDHKKVYAKIPFFVLFFNNSVTNKYRDLIIPFNF